jgi:hypothetical protein
MVRPPIVIALLRLALGSTFEGAPITPEYSQEIAHPLVLSSTIKSIDRPLVTSNAGSLVCQSRPLIID